jgi:hypothetical protein
MLLQLNKNSFVIFNLYILRFYNDKLIFNSVVITLNSVEKVAGYVNILIQNLTETVN